MRDSAAVIAILGLMVIEPALADTIVDFTFSGELTLNFKPTDTVATALGELVFHQTGNTIPTDQISIYIDGVPGYNNQGFGPPQYNGWDIAPDGNLIGGFYVASSSDGLDDGQTFLLSTADPNGFNFWLNDTTEYAFSGTPTFTQIEPVPEPETFGVFAGAVLGLSLLLKVRKAAPS